MANSAIQFYGVDTVLKAYKARDITTWAIFQQRQFITAGDGEDTLIEFIEMLSGNVRPVYTLKVFKSCAVDDIDDKTPCNGSFNFSLDGESSGYGNNGNARLLKRLDELEAKISGPSNDKIDIIGAVNNLIMDPPSLVQVINGIKSIFGGAGGGMVQAVGMNSSRPMIESNHMGETLEHKIERMQAAINILEQNDPDLVIHLEKLARLSADNPAMFKMMLSTLDSTVK